VAVGLFLAGSFSVGWACLAAWLGRDAETRPVLGGTVRHLLRVAMVVYAGSLLMMSLELYLA
jgi:hypothetical protein